VCLRAPAVFCDHVLKHLLIQTQICYQLLKPRVLLLKLPQPLRVVHFHPSILRFPRIDRVLGHSKLPAYFFRAPAGIGLLECLDDLRFGESSLWHSAPPFHLMSGPKSYMILVQFSGSTSTRQIEKFEEANVNPHTNRFTWSLSL